MDPQNPPQSADSPAIHNPLATMEPGEQVVCEIKRHPIGMLGMYLAVGFLLVMLAVLALAVAPGVFSSYSHSQVVLAGMIVLIIAAAAGTGFLLIASKVYWGNMWIVTNDSITQIKRMGLFDKQTSQLSLGNLEDMTAEQDGVAQQMFHYGVISAETAAATDKFTFNYCPNPTYYAQKILQARERFEQGHEPKATQPPGTSVHDLGVMTTGLAQDQAAQSGAMDNDQRP